MSYEPQVAEKSREELLIEHLSSILADTYLLYTKTQGCHWNVVSPLFYALHKLFEEQYRELAEAVDLLAEQIRTLGSLAPASLQQFLELSTLDEMRVPQEAPLMIKSLSDDHKKIAHRLRTGVQLAEELQDVAVADLYTDRIRQHDKMRWMLESHVLG